MSPVQHENSRYTANQRWLAVIVFFLATKRLRATTICLGSKACLTGVGVAGRYLCHTYKFHRWSTGADLMQACCLPVVCRNVFFSNVVSVPQCVCYRCFIPHKCHEWSTNVDPETNSTVSDRCRFCDVLPVRHAKCREIVNRC